MLILILNGNFYYHQIIGEYMVLRIISELAKMHLSKAEASFINASVRTARNAVILSPEFSKNRLYSFDSVGTNTSLLTSKSIIKLNNAQPSFFRNYRFYSTSEEVNASSKPVENEDSIPDSAREFPKVSVTSGVRSFINSWNDFHLNEVNYTDVNLQLFEDGRYIFSGKVKNDSVTHPKKALLLKFYVNSIAIDNRQSRLFNVGSQCNWPTAPKPGSQDQFWLACYDRRTHEITATSICPHIASNFEEMYKAVLNGDFNRKFYVGGDIVIKDYHKSDCNNFLEESESSLESTSTKKL
jgi:hypothetical protein